MDTLNKEFKYFLGHHDELYRKYPDRHVVIKDENVMFDDESFEGALDKAVGAGLKIGTFLVQLCTADESGYTQTFRSPSVETTDYVEEISEYNKYLKIHKQWMKKNNDKCPCGSGKKYKNCHGKSKYSDETSAKGDGK